MINLNGINACAILLLFVLNACLVHNLNDNFNVGTVLFTSNDLNKNRWSRTNIELLEARRYFQNIIPSPSRNFLSEDYVNKLLKYFNNVFSTLKRDADPSISELMEKALSDAIGGYMKVWVLPITKLTYYGGTVSQDNAVKVFEYYESLKRNLNTDGSGWRKPSEITLDTIAITVVPFSHTPHTRSMKYPCEHLAYYEQSNTGLMIPTPYINWNESPYSMFIPLRNESLIQLDSPTSSKALLKYYDIAETCCQSKSPDACNEFNLRFQDWLSDNVIPHINDDNLYIAFGSLLSLLNKTNESHQKTSKVRGREHGSFTLNSLLSSLPPSMASKKFLILILILILEIVWCVPALLCILCSRRKPKMKPRTKFFLDTFRRRRYHTVERIDKSEDKNSSVHKKETKNFFDICQSQVMSNGTNLSQKVQQSNMDADTQYPSHTSKRSTGQVTSIFSEINNEQEYQCDSVTLINENESLDAIRPPHIHSDLLTVSNDIQNTSQTESFTKVHKLAKTITKIIRDKNGSIGRTCLKSSSSNNTIRRTEYVVKPNSQELENKVEVNDICPCMCCIEQGQSNVEATRIAGQKQTKVIAINNNLTQSTVPRNVINKTKTKLPKIQPKGYAPKDIKINQSKGLKLNSGEPLLEIRLDRQPAEITVDITKISKKSDKPSKIPRLATAEKAIRQKSLNAPRPHHVKPSFFVQQSSKPNKKRSMEDLAVNVRMAEQNKLNVTL